MYCLEYFILGKDETLSKLELSQAVIHFFAGFQSIAKGIIFKFQVTLSWQILSESCLERGFLLFFRGQNRKTDHESGAVREEMQFYDMFISSFS